MNEIAQNPQAACLLLRRVGHPVRLSILCSLCSGAKCVTELTGQLGLRQSNMSQHLSQLRAAQLVKTRKAQNKVYYSLNDEKTDRIFAFLRDMHPATDSTHQRAAQ